MIDCFLVLWWTSGVAGSVCGRGFGSVYCGGLCMGHEVAGRAGGGRCGGGHHHNDGAPPHSLVTHMMIGRVCTCKPR